MNKLHSILGLAGIITGALLTYDWTSLGFDPHEAMIIGGVVVMVQNVVKMALNGTGNGPTGLK